MSLSPILDIELTLLKKKKKTDRNGKSILCGVRAGQGDLGTDNSSGPGSDDGARIEVVGMGGE